MIYSSFLQSISMGELYGEVNKMTLEWQDGLMALTVRQCVQVGLLLEIVVRKNISDYFDQ